MPVPVPMNAHARYYKGNITKLVARNIKVMPIEKSMVETMAILFGLSSTIRPNAAAPIPRKKIMSMKPISPWNLDMSNNCWIFAEYCEKL